ncbi:MAG TPA: NAD(P)/FAD-dependent oxidoreductase [Terriglobales bacterium]|jgi:salicylate hydroxylase|nr:NAD(P)/FAD-dependent oxidoreductase [Terriglobales bacterium]
MDVAIFGAGIAGLMAAITLRAQGHHCRIYERLSRGHETGMGFILTPEGVDCLQKFGVRFSGAFSGVPLNRYCCRNAAGEILHEQAMPAGARSMRRCHLISALIGALPANDTLAFGAELSGLEFGESGRVTVACLSSGTRIHADLYVAADGIRSQARQALFPDWPASPAQVLEIVGLLRCDKTIRWAGHDFNKFHAPSGGTALGILPVDPYHVVWYLQFDAHRFPPPKENGNASPEARHAFVEKLVGDWADPVPHLLAKTDFSRVYLWRPMDTDPVPHFYQGNLVLVGDAAHPLSPFTSQGVSSALADAVALASAVNAKVNTGSDLTHALAAYSVERREQCAPYVAKGRELTQQFLKPQAVNGTLLPVA